jgi:hypothetical protein
MQSEKRGRVQVWWSALGVFRLGLALLVVIAAWSGVAAIRGAGAGQTLGWGLLRGAAVTYLAVTGVVYALLLEGTAEVAGGVPWVSTALHQVMPVAVAIEWLLAPPTRLRLWHSLLWLIYPLLWLAYTLGRGAIVDWYPYSFFNPDVSGVRGVVVFSIGIAAGMVAAGWLVLALRRIGGAIWRRLGVSAP